MAEMDFSYPCLFVNLTNQHMRQDEKASFPFSEALNLLSG